MAARGPLAVQPHSLLGTAMIRMNGRPILAILLAALVAEIILPWLLIGISNLYLFDIPAWALWLIFAGPPAAASLAIGTAVIVASWVCTRPARIA